MPGQNFEALDTDTVASLLGISPRQVRNLCKDKGLPCKDDPRGRRFVWRDVLEWYVRYRAEMRGSRGTESRQDDPAPADDQGESMAAALTRKTIAEADLKELQLAKERAQVVSIQDVERNLADVSKSIQTKLLGMPSKLLGRIFGMRDRNALKRILDSEARETCLELSQLGQLQPTSSAIPEDEE